MQTITRLDPLPPDNFSTLRETIGGAKSLVRCLQTVMMNVNVKSLLCLLVL